MFAPGTALPAAKGMVPGHAHRLPIEGHSAYDRSPDGGDLTFPIPQGLAPWQASRVAAHIAAHVDQPIRIDTLAAIARLSTGHFSTAFRRTFGMPPYGFILNQRMERARMLLETTDEPLAQIALSCGMTDQAHLSRLFKQLMGEPPSRWRRMRMRA